MIRGRKSIKNAATDEWMKEWGSLEGPGYPVWKLYDIPEIMSTASRIMDATRKEYVKKSKSNDLPQVSYMLQANDEGVYVEYEIR
ncbi:hypothetical protein EVB64_107 [Rhizobium phage RHph_TM61]|nr:hypothetical protein EVB64_107 [Rhizobium phage RHph_TM61]